MKQKLDISHYTITNAHITRDFNNYKIIHLSDLHYNNFGTNQLELISNIEALQPDLILMTGDMIDKKHTDFENTEHLFKGISNIAPIYLVSGNHEIYSTSINEKMEELYRKYNFNYLNNESTIINKGKSSITLFGLKYTGAKSKKELNKKLKQSLIPADSDTYSILLNHRSDIFDNISQYGYQLVLSGHSHGGIIRLPFIGGIISNNKSLFPKYDGGYFNQNDSIMISSRGLGNSNFIPRINNRPELVVITLKS